MGWMYIFYIEGGVSALWLILWFFLAADSPSQQRFISQEEKDFINTSLDHDESGPARDVRVHLMLRAESTSLTLFCMKNSCQKTKVLSARLTDHTFSMTDQYYHPLLISGKSFAFHSRKYKEY